MPFFKKKNFAKSTIANDPFPIGGTSLIVATGDGAKFPATGSSNVFRGVIWGASFPSPEADPDREVVECYRFADDTFATTRAQEGTAAKEWPAGSNFMLTATAGVFEEMENEINTANADWKSYLDVIPTRASADDPTYVLTFAGVDLTSTIGVGMRIKFTQNSTIRYFIVTAISFSTNTTLTLYGGTDYNVDDTGTYAISNFYYSSAKAPLGFPLTPEKWTEKTIATGVNNQASPVQNTWYNLGSISLSIPIGVWRVSYSVYALCISGSSGTISDMASTLSTSNNSESDINFTSALQSGGAAGTIRTGGQNSRSNTLALASKTTYYLNGKTIRASMDSISHQSTNSGAIIIEAVCAYL